ncbi:CoxG family protein [Ideonella sp. BN130291]|uniref:CoxG family protein n=1 Tax=Ideonella sp. BN130291 TaxID=3112940 RepID=UPI002E260AE5|nr:carbon monoxide dehydrogenase subunit G [Ideonella sp. BN130291]
MELNNQQTLPVGQAEAWAALNDTALLQACIPGCESITPNGDNAYDVAIMAAVGPVKARFKGKLRLADMDPPKAYTLQFDAQGGPAGHGKGTAKVELTPVDASQTLLSYAVQASVGGKVAQIGSRLVDMAAQKMASEFFDNFTAQLAARHPAPAHAAAPSPAQAAKQAGVLARLIASLRRLLGRGAS